MSKGTRRILSKQDEAQIRMDRKNGSSLQLLMKKYDISQSRLYRILEGRNTMQQGVIKVMPMEDILKDNEKKSIAAKELFEQINVGDRVELKHKGEGTRQSENIYYLTNVHKGVVIQKTQDQIFVQESAHKRQGIALSQILSKQVDIRKVG